MKAVALIVELAAGGFKSVAAGTASEITGLVPEIRKSGLFDGKPIKGGIVLSAGHFAPLAKFKCAPGKAKSKG